MRLSKASVTELYARYGITAHWAELLPSGVVYDDYHVALGGDIPTVGSITNFHYAMTLHDLAHFFVATPRARRMPNFGLGQAPHVIEEVLLHAFYQDKTCERIEQRASDLHIRLVALLVPSQLRQVASELAYPTVPQFPPYKLPSRGCVRHIDAAVDHGAPKTCPLWLLTLYGCSCTRAPCRYTHGPTCRSSTTPLRSLRTGRTTSTGRFRPLSAWTVRS